MKPEASCELCGVLPPTNYAATSYRAINERVLAAVKADFLVVWEHDGWNGGDHTAHLFCPTCKERAIAFVKQHCIIDNGDRVCPYHAIRPAMHDWIEENCDPELRDES